MFEFELVDRNGDVKSALPKVDFDGHSATKPVEKVYLKYKVK